MTQQITFAACLMAGLCGIAQEKAPPNPETGTETVMTTYRVKAGSEDDLLKALDHARVITLKNAMVEREPHLILRGQDESKKTYFVEILTWKDHEAPDHAPKELLEVWGQSEALCEKRDGHQGIEFPEVHVVRSGQ